MWTYKTSADWTEGKKGLSASDGKSPIEISTPPGFGGPEGFWTPEDLLTSAVASCIMTSTLFFAERAKIKMLSYTSQATGAMEKTTAGLAITQIVVAVHIALESPEQADAMRKAVKQAEKTCPISNSLNCPIELSLEIT